MSTLDPEATILIYRDKTKHTPCDIKLTALTEEYDITIMAVRDIWNLRTWSWTILDEV